MKHAAIFLDRDGTINEEVDFLVSHEHLRLISESAEAVREARKLGFKVFIITNQSGIARGMLTEKQLSDIHRTLLSKLQAQGASIDAIYYCPHHPDFGSGSFRRDCECRKPKPGMAVQAAHDFDIDLQKSFFIGDKMIDVQTGNNAGGNSILVLTGYGKQELDLCRQNSVRVDYVAADLYDAIQYIKRTVRQEQPSIP